MVHLVPDSDQAYDIGTPTKRIRTIYANIEGYTSDPDIEVNNIRWPNIGPNDVRLWRNAAACLTLDDNSSVPAIVTLANLSATQTMRLADIFLQRTGQAQLPI